MEKPEGKRPLGTLRRILDDNINMYLQDIVERARNGLIWFRTVVGEGIL